MKKMCFKSLLIFFVFNSLILTQDNKKNMLVAESIKAQNIKCYLSEFKDQELLISKISEHVKQYQMLFNPLFVFKEGFEIKEDLLFAMLNHHRNHYHRYKQNSCCQSYEEDFKNQESLSFVFDLKEDRLLQSYCLNHREPCKAEVELVYYIVNTLEKQTSKYKYAKKDFSFAKITKNNPKNGEDEIFIVVHQSNKDHIQDSSTEDTKNKKYGIILFVIIVGVLLLYLLFKKCTYKDINSEIESKLDDEISYYIIYDKTENYGL